MCVRSSRRRDQIRCRSGYEARAWVRASQIRSKVHGGNSYAYDIRACGRSSSICGEYTAVFNSSSSKLGSAFSLICKRE